MLSKKQKRELARILLACVLFALICLLGGMGVLPDIWYLRLILFLVPYAFVGLDVWRKAVLNVLHGQLLDENFLMCSYSVARAVP